MSSLWEAGEEQKLSAGSPISTPSGPQEHPSFLCHIAQDQIAYKHKGWLPARNANGLLIPCMKCPLCPHIHTFFNKFNLKIDICDVHNLDQGSFSCSQCGEQVKNCIYLHIHIYQQHCKISSPSQQFKHN